MSVSVASVEAMQMSFAAQQHTLFESSSKQPHRRLSCADTGSSSPGRDWVKHYNEGRPHRSLGPGVPDPPERTPMVPKSESPHRLAMGALVLAKSVLGGLHHFRVAWESGPT